MANSYCQRCHSTEVKIYRMRTFCNDGVSLSIQVGSFLYCEPRDDSGRYTQVEVGFIQDADGNPMAPPESWTEYADGSFPSDVYAYVPVSVLEAFIAEHGGRKYFT